MCTLKTVKNALKKQNFFSPTCKYLKTGGPQEAAEDDQRLTGRTAPPPSRPANKCSEVQWIFGVSESACEGKVDLMR